MLRGRSDSSTMFGGIGQIADSAKRKKADKGSLTISTAAGGAVTATGSATSTTTSHDTEHESDSGGNLEDDESDGTNSMTSNADGSGTFTQSANGDDTSSLSGSATDSASNDWSASVSGSYNTDGSGSSKFTAHDDGKDKSSDGSTETATTAIGSDVVTDGESASNDFTDDVSGGMAVDASGNTSGNETYTSTSHDKSNGTVGDIGSDSLTSMAGTPESDAYTISGTESIKDTMTDTGNVSFGPSGVSGTDTLTTTTDTSDTFGVTDAESLGLSSGGSDAISIVVTGSDSESRLDTSPTTLAPGGVLTTTDVGSDGGTDSLSLDDTDTAGLDNISESDTTTWGGPFSTVTTSGMTLAPPPTPPSGRAIRPQIQADIDQALKELMKNPKFAELRRASMVPIRPVADATLYKPGQKLGLTSPGGSTITVWGNNIEFTYLRVHNNAQYRKMLKEVIVHETIHAYLKSNESSNPPNPLDLDHDPSADNAKNTGFGSLSKWMQDRYPHTDETDELGLRRGHYVTPTRLFLDIGPKSQRLLIQIVP